MTDPQRPTPIQPLASSDGSLWSPSPSHEWNSLMQRLMGPGGTLDAAAAAKFESDCRSILSHCTPPDAPSDEPRTGLVLGQVQSGKTMSFTGVATLARDNGVRLVVVITGVSVQLLDQSVERLRRDLGIARGSHSGWVHIPIETNANEPAARTAILRQLEMWNDPDALLHLRKTVLVTVMKHHSHLETLTSILRSVGGALGNGGLAAVPTIVIDDEADQASLNTKVRANDLSTIYRRIRQLRDSLPNHTMLQYTATPQAPLLLNIADILSPDFCKVLDPGLDYVGGRAFFIDHPGLVHEIPPRELGSNDTPPAAVPESLLEALRIFILGVAIEIERPDYETRSMLVHPSSQTSVHSVFFEWVHRALSLWSRLLRQPPSDIDREELLSEFERSHADLAKTAPGLPPFASMAPRLRTAVLQIQVAEVNSASGPTPIIQWESSPAWILVGGQALDRGFTVRGLTVSYMPRPLAATGTGNADTLQQRARFFGYKRSYLGHCRIWLEGSVKHALTEYVEHEDALRSSLRAFERLNRPLAEWRRRFILDSSMAPTRSNVIDIGWRESTAGEEPILLRFPHHDAAAVRTNTLLVQSLQTKCAWTSPGDPSWTSSQTHLRCEDMGLRRACEEFLMPFRTCALDDAERLNARLLQFSEMLAHDPDTPVDVLLMSSGRPRHRTANTDDELDQFLQGANPAAPGSGRVPYPGDRDICRSGRVTIQIHMLDVERPDGSIVREVPALAIFAPSARTVRIISQAQGSVTI